MAKLFTLIYRRLQNACFLLHSSPMFLKLIQFTRIAIQYFMKLIGPIFILLCTAFVSFIIWTYLSIVYPLLSSGLAYFNVMVALVFGYNLFYNYFMCVTTDPGSPPVCLDPSYYLGGVTGGDIEGGSKGHGTRYMLDVAPAVVYRYCTVCKVIKPPRTHHCSVSDKCILNMDHYCPWMNNAIGYFNYRYFYLFLLYIFFGALYAAILFTLCYKNNTYELRSVKHYWASQYFKIFSNEQLLVYSIALCIAAVISVGGLLGWHTYLLVTNQTTIEYYVNFEESQRCKELEIPFKNPFDRGWRKNIIRLASSSDSFVYSFSHLPSWLNWLNWFRITAYRMIGPTKYFPPEPEFSFYIDDSNRDQLFKTAIEYNQKLLAASKRRYDKPSYPESEALPHKINTSKVLVDSSDTLYSANSNNYDAVRSDCVSITRINKEANVGGQFITKTPEIV